QVLIFDGECNICSKFIRFIVYVNRNSCLYITDFNSKWTRENIILNSNIDSMIFISNNRKYIYTDSILHVLTETNFLFILLLVLKLIPHILMDMAYKLLAKIRKNIIKATKYPIPSKKFKKIFLS